MLCISTLFLTREMRNREVAAPEVGRLSQNGHRETYYFIRSELVPQRKLHDARLCEQPGVIAEVAGYLLE